LAERSRSGPWVRRAGLGFLRSLALAAAVVFALFGGIAMSVGDKLIFYPDSGGDWDAPRRLGLSVEEIELRSEDGTRLFSWYLRGESGGPTVLFFQGNAGNITDRVDALVALGEAGADVFLLGYRGYGRSEGTPSERGLYSDARAAYRYLTEERAVPPARLVLYGESLGCALALDLASQVPCAGIVLQSPFTSVRDMASRVLPLFPAHWFLKTKFDNLAKIASVAAPMLFFATRRDEVVPFEQTRRLFEAAPGDPTWVEFDDCGHNELFSRHRRDWKEAVAAFFERTSAGR
jgi:hypothetical protein